ncbi:MAG: McrB family protein [Paraclostridium sp.]
MNFSMPRVGNMNQENAFLKEKSLYEFITACKGQKNSELKDIALTYYNKHKNKDYYGQIITQIRFLGLLNLELIDEHRDGIVEDNELLDYIYQSRVNGNKIASDYMNYYLVNWQFPLPNERNAEKRKLEITKPYLIILKTLLELKKIDYQEAYLTQGDVCALFTGSVLKVDNVDEQFATKIIEERLTRCENDIQDRTYWNAILKTSDLFSFDSSQFDVKGKMMVGIKLDEYTEKLANVFINKYKDKIFYVDPDGNYRDLKAINNWALYVNDKEKFKEWNKMRDNIEDTYKFREFCLKKGFYYEENLIRRFITSLETKPFLILTGISGSGKTKIAELWVEYKKEKYNDTSSDKSLHISVGSNWNDNKKLIGFNNILANGDDAYNSTRLVDIIEMANKDEYNDYIVILDEMNLSHVERYFADFLSALEARTKEIKLPNNETIIWSKNLKIIGTVNIDETTYMFSPKVLDRANVIEMNGKMPKEYINSVKESEEKVYKDIKDEIWFNEYVDMLDSVYEAVNYDFGFRVIDEVSQYIKINTELFGLDNFEEYFDEQVCQKILPKLHGAKASLKPKLDALQLIFGEKEAYRLTNNKLEQMQNSVKKGYASFIGE